MKTYEQLKSERNKLNAVLKSTKMKSSSSYKALQMHVNKARQDIKSIFRTK